MIGTCDWATWGMSINTSSSRWSNTMSTYAHTSLDPKFNTISSTDLTQAASCTEDDHVMPRQRVLTRRQTSSHQHQPNGRTQTSIMVALDVENITLDTFKSTLSRYPDVAPSSLAELDTFRYETVPAKLTSLKDKHLLKADVERLVEWKLYAPLHCHMILKNRKKK